MQKRGPPGGPRGGVGAGVARSGMCIAVRLRQRAYARSPQCFSMAAYETESWSNPKPPPRRSVHAQRTEHSSTVCIDVKRERERERERESDRACSCITLCVGEPRFLSLKTVPFPSPWSRQTDVSSRFMRSGSLSVGTWSHQ